MDLPASVKAQRDVEDRAIKLGNERIELQGHLDKTVERAVELMGEAECNGVPLARLAELMQIERSTLYRLREATAILRPHQAEGGK